jgi:hypothetical protein
MPVHALPDDVQLLCKVVRMVKPLLQAFDYLMMAALRFLIASPNTRPVF